MDHLLSMETLILLLLVWVQVCSSWPEGTYGLPMPKSGCPKVENFHWQTGTRTQQTEEGSHASENNHLAGIESTKKHTENKIVQTYCMKTSYAGDGQYTWGKGKYCIYQKSTCPSGFQKGFIYWDDATPLWSESIIQGHTGVLPDGDYDRNTKVYYCCRNDGYPADGIRLPTTSPFYLIKYGGQCQEVEGMDVDEEWVYWSDEDTLNLNNHGGLYPKVQRSKYPYKYTKLYYCYYTAKAPNTSLATALTVIYILAGVVGLIIALFILICLIQRCCMCRQKRKERENQRNHGGGGGHNGNSSDAFGGVGDRMLGREDVIYKPSASGKGDGDIEMMMSTTPTKIIPTLAQAGVLIPTAPALNGDGIRGAGSGDEDDEREEQDEERRRGDEEEDFIPMIIGPDGRPMSQPPSYDEVLMEDTRYNRRGHGHGHGHGAFRRLDNEMYEDDLIREDGKL